MKSKSRPKIQQANKKWRREHKRLIRRQMLRVKSERAKVSMRKDRKAAIQNRREQLDRRENEKSYVNNLISEVSGEEATQGTK